jgi:hypothetical protein
VTSPARAPKTTPPNFVVYRAFIVAITVFLLLSLGFGLVGYGPFAALHRLARPVGAALHLSRTGP